MHLFAVPALVVATISLSAGSTEPGATTADQTSPPSINGITVDGDTLWVASIAGDEVLRIDGAGTILERYDTAGATPDDVAIGPDGAVYTSGMGNGDVGRIADGAYEVIATLEVGINPLEFSPDGELYVGTINPEGNLWHVPLDGAEPEIVATDLPIINAFAVTDDAVIAPAGGFDPGSVIAIDTATGEVTTLADEFPAAGAGATLLLASAADTDGDYFALDNITGEIFHVDLDTGEAELAWTVAGGPWDNLAFGDDTVYLSNFTTPTITAVGPDGVETVITVGHAT